MPEETYSFPLTAEGITKAIEHSFSPEARRHYIDSLKAEIAGYEQKYGMRTEILQEALASGAFVREDLDIVKWMLAVQGLDRVLEAIEDGEEEHPS